MAAQQNTLVTASDVQVGQRVKGRVIAVWNFSGSGNDNAEI